MRRAEDFARPCAGIVHRNCPIAEEGGILHSPQEEGSERSDFLPQEVPGCPIGFFPAHGAFYGAPEVIRYRVEGTWRGPSCSCQAEIQALVLAPMPLAG